MTDQISQQQLAEYSEAFELYDVEDKGAVPLTSLGLVLQTLGLQIPEASLLMLKEKKIEDGEDEVDFTDFLMLVTQGYTEDELVEDKVDARRRQLTAALSLFDHNGDGYIQNSDFRKSMGHVLEEKEMESILKEGDVADTGRIQYKVLLEKWFSH